MIDNTSIHPVGYPLPWFLAALRSMPVACLTRQPVNRDLKPSRFPIQKRSIRLNMIYTARDQLMRVDRALKCPLTFPIGKLISLFESS